VANVRYGSEAAIGFWPQTGHCPVTAHKRTIRTSAMGYPSVDGRLVQVG
jgi:hypothetical protein